MISRDASIVAIGTRVRIDEVRFRSNEEYVGREGIVTCVYSINGLIAVKVGAPYDRTVTATRVTEVR